MSVMIDTSLGEVVVDLFCDDAPLAAKNFLKLCKIKYYNGCLFYNVQQNFMIQTGDPTATGKGGTSVYGLMYGEQARFFEDEISATTRKHDEAGLLSMANMGVPNSNGSQFFFSMRGDDMQHLDGKHTVFAKVMEGMETLEQIDGQFCDDNGRPYRDIRIMHTYVLDDPFDDPPQLVVPDESPERDRPEEERVPLRLGALDEVSLETDEKTELEREKQLREKTARSNAVVLEMIGDLPDADMKPPENVLFVCKLNPVTTDDDLEIIFTRFGSCRAEICRDHITGDSLNYAFVEFEAIESCEEAFKKMNNVLIDDRRIRVDFSQSVAKEWSKYKGRAEGGQKLASGRGGNPAQKQQRQASMKNSGKSGGGISAHAARTGAADGGRGGHSPVSSDSRSRFRSKWGNAPGGGEVKVAAPRKSLPSGVGGRGRREDSEGEASHHHHHHHHHREKSDRTGGRSESSRWNGSTARTTAGVGGGGREREGGHRGGDSSGGRRGRGRSDYNTDGYGDVDSRRGDGRNGGESRHSRAGGGGERSDVEEHDKRRNGWDRGEGRDEGKTTRDNGGGGGGGGDEAGRTSRAEGDHRSSGSSRRSSGDGSGGHHHHGRSDKHRAGRRGEDADLDASNKTGSSSSSSNNGRRRRERHGDRESGRGGGEWASSKRKGRSRSRSRSRSRDRTRGKGDSRDRTRRR